MSNAIIEAPQSRSLIVAHAMTLKDLQAQITRIRQAMKAVMEPGVHYGVIPGTPKPTLYKPGAELLFAMFRISPEPDIDDLSTEDEIRYRVRVRGVHAPTGNVIGWGVGECSTNEEKYKWRNAVCDEEFNEADPDRKRVKWQKWKDRRSGEWVTEKRYMVRTVPADLANTVLKMATKRARIDLALSALGASDVFNQDLEDLERELRETLLEAEDGGDIEPAEQPRTRGKPATREPQATNGGNGGGSNGGSKRRGVATEKQVKLIRVKLDQAGIEETELLAAFELGELGELPFDKVNAALDWIKHYEPGAPAPASEPARDAADPDDDLPF